MPIIQLRKPFSPPLDCEPSPGNRSVIWDELSELSTVVGGLGDDDAKATVQPAADAAIAALGRCHRMQWQVADGQEKLMTSPMGRSSLDAATREALAPIPQSGWGGPSDLIVAQGAARSRVFRDFQREALKLQLEKLRPKIDRAASTAVDAFQDFGDAIDRAVAEFETPISLAADLQLIDLQRQARLEDEIEAQGSDGMRWCLGQLQSAVRFDRDELITNLIAATQRVANKWMREPIGKNARDRAASHYAGSIYTESSTTEAADPHSQARAVLKWIADFKAASRPASIAVATGVRRRLQKIFTSVLGVRPSLRNLYNVDADLSQQGKPWEVDESWPARFAPPDCASPLPGWTRIRLKTDAGVPVREAAEGEIPLPPMARAEVKNLSQSTFDAQRRADLVTEFRGGGK
jgi:hypothetical protein